MLRKNKIFLLILILIFPVIILSCENQINGENKTNFDKENLQKAKVTRVVDGDTIIINNNERVRLILVNSPESVHPDESKNTKFGEKASNFTKKILENKIIYLEKDVSNRDKYDRLLRYVYLEDGTLFNELLVKEGYAKITTYPPDIKYKDIILKAQKYARENNKGLWN